MDGFHHGELNVNGIVKYQYWDTHENFGKNEYKLSICEESKLNYNLDILRSTQMGRTVFFVQNYRFCDEHVFIIFHMRNEIQ